MKDKSPVFAGDIGPRKTFAKALDTIIGRDLYDNGIADPALFGTMGEGLHKRNAQPKDFERLDSHPIPPFLG